jgi:hypothetical protein
MANAKVKKKSTHKNVLSGSDRKPSNKKFSSKKVHNGNLSGADACSPRDSKKNLMNL